MEWSMFVIWFNLWVRNDVNYIRVLVLMMYWLCVGLELDFKDIGSFMLKFVIEELGYLSFYIWYMI